jgi:hypothetical protein
MEHPLASCPNGDLLKYGLLFAYQGLIPCKSSLTSTSCREVLEQVEVLLYRRDAPSTADFLRQVPQGLSAKAQQVRPAGNLFLLGGCLTVNKGGRVDSCRRR